MKYRSLLIGLALVAGCDHKSQKDDQVDLPKQPSPDPTPAANMPKPTPVEKPAEAPGSAAAAATPPAGNDDVRAPVAADLAEYSKNIKGSGTKLSATIDTSQGTFHCELFGDKAPATVANFIGLATGQKAFVDANGSKQKGKPFFDGLTFHRVIPEFMIQGGDPKGTGTGGPGYDFNDEISPDLKMQPGTLAMANAGKKPDGGGTNGSQFFITEIAPDWLNGKHTIFGQCKEVDLVKQIARVPKEPGDKPTTPVVIKKVTITKS
jgi:peptidyl-prolyl cis-trans isomerase A (cyclophilin A)